MSHPLCIAMGAYFLSTSSIQTAENTLPENVSCLINTTNCCGLLTPVASTEGRKTKELL